MQQLVFLSLIAGVLFSGCARVGTSVSSAVSGDRISTSQGLDVSIQRGSENQVQLKVLGKVTGAYAAKADLAAMEADGYVMASDRFVQMDIARRMTRGKLAEVLGPAAEEADHEKIGVGLPFAVDNSTAKIQAEHPAEYAVLEAFARGVNRFIEEMPAKRPEWVRQYQLVTRESHYKPDPWEPADSIAVATGLSFYLSSNLRDKMAYTAISQVFLLSMRWEEFKGFLNFMPIKPVSITGNAIQSAAVDKARSNGRSLVSQPPALVPMGGMCSEGQYSFPLPPCGRPPGMGSNNWAVSRKEAGGDVTLLANDPHLPLFFPMTFYEVSIDSKTAGGTLKVRGMKPVGVPAVLIGHNDQIAWGMTNFGGDVDDIYIESFTADGKFAKIAGKHVKVETKYYPYRIRRGGKVVGENLAVRFVEGHGPVFSDHQKIVKKMVENVEKVGHMGSHLGISYKWTGHPGTKELVAIIGINRAQNFAEFKKSLDYFQTGIQNMVFADRKGQIGYYAHGDLPVRPYLSEDMPPHLAITSDVEAREWAPEFRKETPQITKSDGVIVTANNNPYNQSRDMMTNPAEYVSFGFTDAIRAFRIEELLAEKKKANGVLTVEDMRVIQNDKKDVLALSILEQIEKIGHDGGISENARVLFTMLMDWKASGGSAERAELGPTYFYGFAEELLKEQFKYVPPEFELPEPLQKYARQMENMYNQTIKEISRTSPAVKTLYHSLAQAAKSDEDSDQRKAARKTISVALEKGYAQLVADNKLHLAWGKVNRLKWLNPMEGLLPQFLNLSIERGGAFETVDPSAPGLGASFRIVMGIPESGEISAKISVSGGNYSPFELKGIYGELERWRDGGQRDLVPFTP